MDSFVEQPLAPTLSGFAIARVLFDIRNHARIEDHLPIARGIKAAIEVEIRAFQGSVANLLFQGFCQVSLRLGFRRLSLYTPPRERRKCITCPHGESTATTERSDRTTLGYRRFRCRDCSRVFHERTGTLFNRLQYPTDVVCLVVFWRFRSQLRLRDLAEMFLQRGIAFTHEAMREWEAKLAPLLGEALRKRRHGAVGHSWYVDDTYMRVQGQWQYLYRAIDRDGQLVDVRLGATRDLAAAEACFRSAWTVAGVTPERITTDGHDAYPSAIRTVFGDQVMHRTNRYLNNHLEQDHRGVKQRL
jgi:putative transposase